MTPQKKRQRWINKIVWRATRRWISHHNHRIVKDNSIISSDFNLPDKDTCKRKVNKTNDSPHIAVDKAIQKVIWIYWTGIGMHKVGDDEVLPLCRRVCINLHLRSWTPEGSDQLNPRNPLLHQDRQIQPFVENMTILHKAGSKMTNVNPLSSARYSTGPSGDMSETTSAEESGEKQLKKHYRRMRDQSLRRSWDLEFWYKHSYLSYAWKVTALRGSGQTGLFATHTPSFFIEFARFFLLHYFFFFSFRKLGGSLQTGNRQRSRNPRKSRGWASAESGEMSWDSITCDPRDITWHSLYLISSLRLFENKHLRIQSLSRLLAAQDYSLVLHLERQALTSGLVL